MQFKMAPRLPPRGAAINEAPKTLNVIKAHPSEAKKWVLAQDDGPESNGQVNYAKYAAPAAQPGPVLSAKTGKEYTPSMANFGKKQPAGRGQKRPPVGMTRQASYGA